VQFSVGDIQVSRILEMEIPFLTPADAFPGVDLSLVESQRHWLEPNALCPETGMLVIAIQTWVIRTPHHMILVDTCIGCDKTNHYFENWHRRTDDSWYRKLLTAGIDPVNVDYVFCTHLHGDHCGWNTRLVDGRWVPTFPNAKYIIARKEVAHAAEQNTPAYQESVLPIMESGQVLAVDADYALDDNVCLAPTPGHTPGHIAVHLASHGQRAVLCGDLIHSPLQCLYPEWQYWIDHDPIQAIQTRKEFLSCRADTEDLVITAHFPSPSVGQVKTSSRGFYFNFLEQD